MAYTILSTPKQSSSTGKFTILPPKTSPPVLPSKPTPWADQVEPSLSWKVSPEEMKNPSLIKSAVRPVVNLLGLPLRAAENVAKIPFAYSNAIKEGKRLNNTPAWQTLGSAAIESAKKIPFAPTIMAGAGALSTGIQKLFGVKMGDPLGIQGQFGKAVQGGKDIIKDPLGSAEGVAQSIYKMTQENPEMIPLILEGARKTYSDFTGKVAPDVISKVASPVTKPANAVIEPVLAARRAKAEVKAKQSLDQLTNTIVQGTTKDIEIAKKALSDVDVSDVKTYKDLTNVLDDRVEALSNQLDQALATNKQVKPLNDLNVNSKVGDSTVTHNYVRDAILQLKDLYKKTNNPVSLEKITQLESKANSQGLTVQEINKIAKLHGQELNAFNANGEAASGLTKQAAENTRTGLKTTAREMFGDPTYKAADIQISNLIRTRDLVGKVSENVNKLQSKIIERGWGEKTGRAIGQVMNILSGNTLKGAVEYLIPRGQGYKVMNALDLEAKLQKNLTKLQSILNDNLPESVVQLKLQEIINQNSGQPLLPVKKP